MNTLQLFTPAAYAKIQGVTTNYISKLLRFDYKHDPTTGEQINKEQAMNEKKLLTQAIGGGHKLIIDCEENKRLFARPAPYRGERITRRKKNENIS